MVDDYEKLQIGPRHMTIAPACADDAPKSFIELIETDEVVKDAVRQLSLHGEDLEKCVEDLKSKP